MSKSPASQPTSESPIPTLPPSVCFAITMPGGGVAANEGMLLVYDNKPQAEEFKKWHNKHNPIRVTVERVVIGKAGK